MSLHRRFTFFLLCIVLPSTHLLAQGTDSIRVLFLGNSYTYGNNLPTLVSNLAAADGKYVYTDMSAPGGYTLDGHSTNATSQNKIAQGGWDFIVLQEQSQIPTIDYYRYNFMYPAAHRLEDSIRKYNPCAKVVMFMTWGRRFGGQQCDQNQTYCSPVFVDFHHMTDSLESAYMGIAEQIGGCAAPVGVAWGNVLADTNLVLHTGDNSHPNFTGSYLAACTFHAMFWNSSPAGISYTGSLSPALADYLQKKADSTVFHSYSDWNRNVNAISAGFSQMVNGDTVVFTDTTTAPAGASYLWTFGDGDSATTVSPTHVYDTAGTFQVTLVVSYCDQADTVSSSVTIVQPVNVTQAQESTFGIYPNPAEQWVRIARENDLADNASLQLLNSLGARVLEIDWPAGQREIRLDLSRLPAGVYHVRFDSAAGSRVKRLLLR